MQKKLRYKKTTKPGVKNSQLQNELKLLAAIFPDKISHPDTNSKISGDNKMSEDEAKRELNTIAPSPVSEHSLQLATVAKRSSFLRRLIAGEFNSLGINACRSSQERELFNEFNRLSDQDKTAEYQKLQKKLIELSF